MSPSRDEPSIPQPLRRPLAAIWISLGLHAAVIALLQVSPPAGVDEGAPVIEARLVQQHAEPAVGTEPPPESVPPAQAAPARLAPSETAEPLPVAKAEPQPPATPAAAVPPAASPPAEAAAVPQQAAPPPGPLPSITSAVDLTYYTVRDLDVQPRALREIVPEYPYDADRQRLSGKVHVQLKLEADGRVSEVEVVNASPAGVFEESARNALRRARFAPAQKNGRPVRAQVVITVVYDWEGRRR